MPYLPAKYRVKIYVDAVEKVKKADTPKDIMVAVDYMMTVMEADIKTMNK